MFASCKYISYLFLAICPLIYLPSAVGKLVVDQPSLEDESSDAPAVSERDSIHFQLLPEPKVCHLHA